jgi:glutathione S-transferase
MKLYYSKGACSLASRIIINELGLTCEYEAVDLPKKLTQDGKNFFAINPKGSVPVLITNNNETLTENAVILQYLADTNQANNLLPPVGNFGRYRVLESLNYIATELHKGFGPLFNPNIPQELKDKIFLPAIKAKLTYINGQLELNKFVAGDQFTLPDAYLFTVLRWALFFKIDFKEWSQLPEYFQDLSNRKSIKESVEQEGIKISF